MRFRLLLTAALLGLVLLSAGCGGKASYPDDYSEQCQACVDPICRVNCAPDASIESCAACITSVLNHDCASVCTPIFSGPLPIMNFSAYCLSVFGVVLVPGALTVRALRRRQD